MKTTFKKTFAAMSAAAVVAASAVAFAVPASAASDAVCRVGNVEVTLSELAAANYQVTVPIILDNNPGVNNLGVRFGYDESQLSFVSESAVSGMDASLHVAPTLWFAFMDQKLVTASEVGSMTFELPSTAAVGDVYTIEGFTTDANGAPAVLGINGENVGLADVQSGTITIIADPTEAPTEAPTTEAPTTAAPVVTTTAAPVATPTTGSPKTGDALPVAGVAVAVAVIGGVALVSKKRK